MTTRILTLIAAVLAAPLSGQELPADPGDFADMVAEGSVWASRLFDRGCPSESEWSGAALEALEDHAETDMTTRKGLAVAVRDRIADCPEADRDRAEEWVVRWVNTVYEADRWTSDFDVNAATESQIDSLQADGVLTEALAPFASEGRIQALARKIACDTGVYWGLRWTANDLLTRDRLKELVLNGMLALEDATGSPKCRGFTSGS